MSSNITVLSRTNNVFMNRGDSFKLIVPVSCLDIGDSSIIYNDYKIFFGIMEPNHKFEDSIIRKIYTYNDIDENGELTIILDPTDTEYLAPGLYYYQVKSYKSFADSETKKEEVHTIIDNSKFAILD